MCGWQELLLFWQSWHMQIKLYLGIKVLFAIIMVSYIFHGLYSSWLCTNCQQLVDTFPATFVVNEFCVDFIKKSGTIWKVSSRWCNNWDGNNTDFHRGYYRCGLIVSTVKVSIIAILIITTYLYYHCCY